MVPKEWTILKHERMKCSRSKSSNEIELTKESVQEQLTHILREQEQPREDGSNDVLQDIKAGISIHTETATKFDHCISGFRSLRFHKLICLDSHRSTAFLHEPHRALPFECCVAMWQSPMAGLCSVEKRSRSDKQPLSRQSR